MRLMVMDCGARSSLSSRRDPCHLPWRLAGNNHNTSNTFCGSPDSAADGLVFYRAGHKPFPVEAKRLMTPFFAVGQARFDCGWCIAGIWRISLEARLP
jgi:hypothetical protein